MSHWEKITMELGLGVDISLYADFLRHNGCCDTSAYDGASFHQRQLDRLDKFKSRWKRLFHDFKIYKNTLFIKSPKGSYIELIKKN